MRRVLRHRRPRLRPQRGLRLRRDAARLGRGVSAQPVVDGRVGDTKLTLNAGKGIKAPSIFQELSSLYALSPPARPSSLGVQPIGPERSRSFDVGVEQGFAGGRAPRARRLLPQRRSTI